MEANDIAAAVMMVVLVAVGVILATSDLLSLVGPSPEQSLTVFEECAPIIGLAAGEGTDDGRGRRWSRENGTLPGPGRKALARKLKRTRQFIRFQMVSF